MANKTTGIASSLKVFIEKLPDIKYIALSTADGLELSGVHGAAFSEGDDVSFVAGMVPGFSVSAEQSSKFGLGATEFGLTWLAKTILIQAKIDLVVLSILVGEGANVGLVQEHAATLIAALRPHVNGFMPEGAA